MTHFTSANKFKTPFSISQGQVECHVRLQTRAPEDAEFYVVVKGSRLTHVTAAKQGKGGLRFTVPGWSNSRLCHDHTAPGDLLRFFSVSHRS